MHLTPYLQHKRPDKHGECIVYLLLRHQNKTAWVNTGIKVAPKCWDGRRITRGKQLSAALNKKLERFIGEYEQALLQLEAQNLPVTIQAVQQRVKARAGTAVTEYARDVLDHAQHLKFKTKEQQYYMCDKLDDYHPGVMFHEIDERYLESLQAHWQHHGLGPKSIEGLMRCLRKFFNMAQREGLVTHYPFRQVGAGQGYRVGNRRGIREHLTLDEINRLEDLLERKALSSRHERVCRWFLFACYTGLRGQDCRSLTPEAVVQDRYLRIRTGKTGELDLIPLSDRAIKHLDRLFDLRLQKNYRQTNMALRELCQMAGIERAATVSFHCARHSFAVNSLILGIPVDVIQKVLGHSDISTTQIYAQIKDAYLHEQLAAWNKTDQ